MNSYIDLDNQLHSLADPATGSTNGPRIVWVPSVRITILQGFVPGKSRAQWQAALPYAFEEQLAQPIEEVHFAFIDRDKAGLVTVAVVAKQQLQRWVNLLAEAGLEQAWLVPECFRLPEPNGQANHQNDGERVGVFAPSEIEPASYIVRVGSDVGPGVGFSLPQTQWPGFLALYPNQSFSAQTLDSSVNPREVVAFNLCQGDYAPKGDATAFWPRWRWPMGLAAAWIVLVFGQMLLETRQTLVHAQNLQQQTEALFRQAIPESQRIVNIQVQTQSFLNQVNSQGENFLPLQTLAHIEPFILAASGIQPGRFDWQNQTLSLALTAKTTEQLDQLLIQVNEALTPSLQARLTIRQVVADKVEATLYVTSR